MPGSDADMAIIDLDKEWTLTSDLLYSKNKHSPYIGATFRGSVEQTIVRGKTVFNRWKVRGQTRIWPGYLPYELTFLSALLKKNQLLDRSCRRQPLSFIFFTIWRSR